jgi:hypothetical protein
LDTKINLFLNRKNQRMKRVKYKFAALFTMSLTAFSVPSFADKIKNPTAVYAGLDKITGRIISFEVGINETVQFGSLQLTPRVCYSRPTTEAPNTNSFIEVDEINANNEYKRIFSGWVFASSPGLSAIEHPVYDLWLAECKGGTAVIKTAPETLEPPTAAPKPENTVRIKPEEGGKLSAEEKSARDAARAASRPKTAPTQSFFPTNVPPPAQGGVTPSAPNRSNDLAPPMSLDPASKGGN